MEVWGVLHHFIEVENGHILFLEDGTIFTGSRGKLEEVLRTKKDSISVLESKSISSRKRLKKLIILMTDDCNLRCRYCYLDYGNFCMSDTKKTISLPLLKKILKQVYEKFPDGIENILFFGGEPLIAYSRIKDTIEYVLNYCKEYSVAKPNFGLVTNGILLDEFKWKILSKYHVKVKVSLDGEERIHNEVRKDILGKPTWNRIEQCIRSRIKENGKGIFFEMTINRLHLELLETGRIEKCMHNFKQMGFAAGSIACTEFSKDPSLDFQKEDMDKLKELVSRIVDYCFCHMEEENSLYIIDVMQAVLFLLQKKGMEYHCYAGVKQYTITANGDILPCTAYAHSDVKVTIKDNTFASKDEKVKEQNCKECWIHNFCRSFCYYRTQQRKKQNIDFEVRCIYVQAIYESVIRNIVKLKQSGKQALLINKVKECKQIIEGKEA